ncbi:DNA polymerase I [Candidatus Cloacimonadota bacterium]
MADKLFLIDGTAIIYRAFFAFIRNPLINSKGQNTGAIFGLVNTMIKMIEKYNIRHILISFDQKEKTFRHQIDSSYKANRPPAPDDLVSQIEPIRQFFQAIRIEEISIPGYEADDVLATLAQKYKSEYEVIIVTGDKDFSQLVDDKVKLYDPFKEKVTGPDEVVAKYGLKPEQFIDYLAICGDSADNIPGVRGIGPKGAVKLLTEYETLENIYDNIENISPAGVKTKLEDSREAAFMSQKLAEIVRDVPLDNFPVIDPSFNRNDLINAAELLKSYELNSIARKLEPEETAVEMSLDFGNGESGEDEKFKAILIDKKEDFDNMLLKLKDSEIIAFDTETTSEDPMKADLAGISLCANESEAYYISVGHQMADNVEQKYVLEKLGSLLNGRKLIAHNVKYDYIVLNRAGLDLEGKFCDTMIADYLLHPTERHSLEACSQREFDHEMIHLKDLIGTGRKQITFDLVSTSRAAKYSAEDAWITYKLFEVYSKQLEQNDLTDLFNKLEMPLFKVLANMEMNGVYIDSDYLADLSKKNQKTIGELTVKIYDIAGYQFNLNSTQQLGKVLFEDLKIPPVKKTKTGYSTDVTVLEKLSDKHEIARLLMEYRQLTKLESTYVTALPKLVNERTGRVHSSFNQTVASTGRLSSSNPNLQNIPIRTGSGKEIRKAFTVPNDEYVILSADYSQIELRILAFLSEDPTLIEAFGKGLDIHSQTASIIYNKPLDDVTPDERRYAKVINFGLMYGMGPQRIHRELNITLQEAVEFVENYFAKFPTIRTYLDRSLDEANKKGYVQTILGRKLFLPDLYSSDNRRAGDAKRVAINMPIQGSAADIIKLAMISIDNKIEHDQDIKMIIQVHDELVFKVRKIALSRAEKLIKTEMENALPEEYAKIVKVTVDIGVGKDWFEAH